MCEDRISWIVLVEIVGPGKVLAEPLWLCCVFAGIYIYAVLCVISNDTDKCMKGILTTMPVKL